MVEVVDIDSTTLSDVFASVLINGTHHWLKRCFDRGYMPHHEWTSRVFDQVQLCRNNQFWRFFLKDCVLIHGNLLVSEKPGSSKF